MFEFIKRRRKDDGSELDDIFVKAAAKPATLNADAFIYDAKRIVEAFLMAVMAQDASILPMRRMEEKFYNDTVAAIRRDASGCVRTCSFVEFKSFTVSDYDNSQQYAVRTISYDGLYTASGCYGDGNILIPYEDKRLGTFTFLNDQRLGFVLSGHQDWGARQ